MITGSVQSVASIAAEKMLDDRHKIEALEAMVRKLEQKISGLEAELEDTRTTILRSNENV